MMAKVPNFRLFRSALSRTTKLRGTRSCALAVSVSLCALVGASGDLDWVEYVGVPMREYPVLIPLQPRRCDGSAKKEVKLTTYSSVCRIGIHFII
jgi:hypothetical protein